MFLNNFLFNQQYTQKHAMLMESSALKELPEPLASPFPEYFFVQSKFAQIEVN